MSARFGDGWPDGGLGELHVGYSAYGSFETSVVGPARFDAVKGYAAGRRSRRCALDVMDDNIPDWPEEHVCSGCGEPVWKVVADDGEDVELHTMPLDTELVGDLAVGQVRVRAKDSYRRVSSASDATQWRLRRAQGWSLHDPMHIRTRAFVPDLETGDHWLWYASPAHLAVENTEVLWTEHIYVCQAASDKKILAHMFSERGPIAAAREQLNGQASAALLKLPVSLPSELRAQSGVQKPANPTADQLALF